MCQIVETNGDLFAEAQRVRRRLERVGHDVEVRQAQLKTKLDHLVELTAAMNVLYEEFMVDRWSDGAAV